MHLNYGAALHSYAFGRVLESMGVEDYVFVDYMPAFMRGYNLRYPFLNLKHNRSLGKSAAYLLDLFNNLAKYNKFQTFFNTRCKFTPQRYRAEDLDSLAQRGVETYICQSDVIWKIESTGGVDNGYFLNFLAARSARRIAYAPSLGRGASKHVEVYQKLLHGFECVSARERQGAEFLSEILGREIEWVLDPTLLLTGDEYRAIARAPRKAPQRPYVLMYNCMSNSRAMVAQAQRYATQHGLELIELSVFAANRMRYKHRVVTSAGVEEFLWYIDNAQAVFCNGFHGACLSVVHEKPFVLFQRDKSDYRMNNLVEALGVEQNFVKKECENDAINPSVLNVDYMELRHKLEELRARSRRYLLGALRLAEEPK